MPTGRGVAHAVKLGTPNQARVIREVNDLILCLVGLSFPTGKLFIETKYFGLLFRFRFAGDALFAST